MERMNVEISESSSSYSLLGRKSERVPLYPVFLETETVLKEIPLTRLEFDVLRIFLKCDGYFDNVVLQNHGLSTKGRDGAITNCITRLQEAIPELVIKHYGHFVPGHFLNGEYIHRAKYMKKVLRENPTRVHREKIMKINSYNIQPLWLKIPCLFAPRNVHGQILPILNIWTDTASIIADTTPLGLAAIRELAISSSSLNLYELSERVFRGGIRGGRELTSQRRTELRNSYNLAVKLTQMAMGGNEDQVVIPEYKIGSSERYGRPVTFPQWI